jgi:hypothetical protein
MSINEKKTKAHVIATWTFLFCPNKISENGPQPEYFLTTAPRLYRD